MLDGKPTLIIAFIVECTITVHVMLENKICKCDHLTGIHERMVRLTGYNFLVKFNDLDAIIKNSLNRALKTILKHFRAKARNAATGFKPLYQTLCGKLKKSVL